MRFCVDICKTTIGWIYQIRIVSTTLCMGSLFQVSKSLHRLAETCEVCSKSTETEAVFIKTNHHPHVVPQARISLTLSRHFSLSFIPSGRSSGLHPVSSHSCCMYVRAGRPAFARPYVGVHRSSSLMSSSLFLQQCPACLVRLTLIVFLMGGRWPYSRCLVVCCYQNLFNIARNILVLLPSSFFPRRLVSVKTNKQSIKQFSKGLLRIQLTYFIEISAWANVNPWSAVSM